MLFRSVQHGDFCRHNLLLSRNAKGSQLGIIDWTDSKRMGLPLHDLFFFLTTYFLQVRKQVGIEGFAQAFNSTFFEQNPYSSQVLECLRVHCRKMGIDIHLAQALFAMFLVERAIFELAQVTRCSERGGLPRFTIYLANLAHLDYPEAIQAQFWIHFFKLFVMHRGEFLGSG